ncbi:MAG TPA: MmcQ/YjbR family DNA-binding protein [Phototrophicaceae bacterium]|nr:MmcQ/YjbR family DNA-binding protein [Phototrophicaceae bacterium]
MPDSFDRVRAVALALPGVAEGLTFGTPALKVRGKYLAQMWHEDNVLILSMEIVERDLRIEAEPDIFFITDHFRDWPGVLVRMDQLDDADLRDLIESAWRRRAPKKLVKTYDAQM